MKKNKKKISIEVDVNIERDGKGYHVWCMAPGFEGLHVGGKTKKETLKNADDAILAYLLSCIKHNELKVVKSINRGEAWTVKLPVGVNK